MPQGEKLHEFTNGVRPVNVFKSVPEEVSQIFTVLSSDPDTIKLPQGEKLHVFTSSVWPFNVLIQFPERTSQSFTVWSNDPDTIKFPHGEKLHYFTTLVWPPFHTFNSFPYSSSILSIYYFNLY